MSNYTITTDFGAKDSLPSSNSAKVVRGSEFTTEFTNIQTAIATKADTAGDTFTGVVNFSADVAVNTNTLFVDVSEAKVGIGTTSPDQKLQVDGNIRLGDTATGVDDDEDYGLRTGGSLTLHANDSGNNTFNTALAFDVGNASGAQAASSKIQFKVNNTERMSIDSSGNVGIGTSSPSSKLHVQDSLGSPQIRIDNQGTGSGIASLMFHGGGTGNPTSIIQSGGADSGNVGIIFKHGNNGSETERMRIDTSGNVGIGTTNPDELLHVSGGDVRIESTFPRLYLTDTNNNSDYSIINNNGQFGIYDDTNATYRMVIANTSGNVGIATTSPDAKLHVNGGDLKISSDSDTSNGDGKPAILFAETTDDQVDAAIVYNGDGVSGENNYIGIGVFNSTLASEDTLAEQKLLTDLNITRDGKVGIGTTSPTQKLDVSSAGTTRIQVKNTNLTSSGLYIAEDGTGAQINETGAYPLRFNTSGTERMRIDSSGNVGIATTSASYPLDVDGLIASRDAYLITANSSGTPTAGAFMFRPASNTLALGTNSTERMRIDSSGNVGIGTSSPQSDGNTTNLEVSSANGARILVNNTDTSGRKYGFFADNSGNFGLGDYTADVTRMLVDSSGNLKVGTTSTTPSGGGFAFISGTIGQFRTSHATGTPSGNWYQAFYLGSSVIGTITQAGTTGVNYNTSSDERLKENIADSADAGSKVDAIQIRQFDWKADGSHQDYGVIAQELVEVVPEAVSEGDTEEEMMGVDYSKLVPMLIKEVQSLRSRVAELENA